MPKRRRSYSRYRSRAYRMGRFKRRRFTYKRRPYGRGRRRVSFAVRKYAQGVGRRVARNINKKFSSRIASEPGSFIKTLRSGIPNDATNGYFQFVDITDALINTGFSGRLEWMKLVYRLRAYNVESPVICKVFFLSFPFDNTLTHDDIKVEDGNSGIDNRTMNKWLSKGQQTITDGSEAQYFVHWEATHQVSAQNTDSIPNAIARTAFIKRNNMYLQAMYDAAGNHRLLRRYYICIMIDTADTLARDTLNDDIRFECQYTGMVNQSATQKH